MGGFVFASLWHPAKFYVQRTDGYKLVIISAFFGVVLLLIASVIVTYAPAIHVLKIQVRSRQISEFWHKVVPMSQTGEAALSGKASLALFLSLFGAPLNLLAYLPGCQFLGREAAVKRVIIRKADPLENLLRKALAETKLVLVTMKSEKVYIGYVARNLNPAYPLESVGIIPVFSGYRDATTKQMHLEVNYESVRERLKAETDRKRRAVLEEFRSKLIEEAKKQEGLDEKQIQTRVTQLEPKIESFVSKTFEAQLKDKLDGFEIIVRVDEIVSGTIFDSDTYEAHFIQKLVAP